MKTLLIFLAGAAFIFGLGVASGVILTEIGFFPQLSFFHPFPTQTFSPLKTDDYTKVLAQLNLNADQKKQISEILQTVTNSPEQHQQMQMVLTPEQINQWNQLFPAASSSSSSPHQPSFIPKTSQH